jgi:4-hydroxy-tetrahydrodipicolinate reductase
MSLLPVAIDKQTPILVCTTGFSEAQHASLVDTGRSVPIMVGANMSVSVMAMYELVKTAARLLGEEFDIEILIFIHGTRSILPRVPLLNSPNMQLMDVASPCPK